MKAEVFLEGTRLPVHGINKKKIRGWVQKAGTLLGLADFSIAVIITDNGFIKDINRTYRGKDTPTDVITFSYAEQPFPGSGELGNHIGDIFISMEKAGEQAVEYEVTVQNEFKRLLVHGILHLAGFDHEKNARDAHIMKEKETEIIDLI